MILFRKEYSNRKMGITFFICLILLYGLLCFPKQLFDDPYSQIVNDANGNLLGAKISVDGQWRFPELDSVPMRFQQALVTFEDKRFNMHWGVDPLAIGNAIRSNIKQGKIVRGGSTITMQLMRISEKGQKRSYFNKIREAFKAIIFECLHSKKEIMILYASHAPFGGNVVGLEAASWRYFGKAPNLLSWSEAATLAVLPNSPSLIHPGKNREALLVKRNMLLTQMQKEGLIDSTTCALSVLEPIPPKPLALPSFSPHLLEYVSKSHQFPVRLNSTIDMNVQLLALDVVHQNYQEFKQNQIHNMAVMIMDTKSGEILAYVGNTDDISHENRVDMVQAKRSSGSILKPFLYAAKIDAAELMPHQLVNDIPIYIDGFSPKNFDKEFRGAVPASDALAMSLNIPAVLELQEFGVGKFINILRKSGVTTINKDEDYYGLSLILGGAEVSLFDVCGAYASMGRTMMTFTDKEAQYTSSDVHPPRLEKRSPEKVKYGFEPSLFSAGAIHHTFDALTQLKRPDEEGMWQFFNSTSTIAWKTGTSFGHKDAWAVGVTPSYTIGVWVGNADGEGRPELTGSVKAAPVLFDLINRLPKKSWFKSPLDDLVPTVVCRKSGFTASPFCAEVDTMFIAHVSDERSICPYHKTIFTSDDGKEQVLRECTNGEMLKQSWFELPPTVAFYYRNQHPDYLSLPPFSEDCRKLLDTKSGTGIDLIYPAENTKIFLPKNIKGEQENIVLEAGCRRPKSHIFWHLDNVFLGTTSDFHTMTIKAPRGLHTIAIVDDQGNEVKRRFEIVSD